jgi:hypothetical protein
MRTLSGFVVAGLISLATAHTARAEELAPTSAPKRVAVTDEVAVTAGSAGIATTLEPTEPGYPREVLARPMTYPAGVATAGVDLGSVARDLGKTADVRIVAGVGLTDRIQLDVGTYDFATDHVSDGAFHFGGAGHVGMFLDDKLDLGVKLDSGYSFESDAIEPAHLGMIASYMVTPKLALMTPGDQLQVGLDEVHAVSLALPIAVGYQVTPHFYLQLDTTVASLGVSDAQSQVMFSDTTPVALTAFYSLAPTVDVFAGLSADLTPPDAPGEQDNVMQDPPISDTMNLVVGARYYFGRM